MEGGLSALKTHPLADQPKIGTPSKGGVSLFEKMRSGMITIGEGMGVLSGCISGVLSEIEGWIFYSFDAWRDDWPRKTRMKISLRKQHQRRSGKFYLNCGRARGL